MKSKPEVLQSLTFSEFKSSFDGRIGAASAVLRVLHRPVVVKKELSQKAKLSIHWSIYPHLWSRVASSAGCLGSPLEIG